MTSQRPRPFRSHLVVPGVVVYWAQVEPAAWVWAASWVLLAAHLAGGLRVLALEPALFSHGSH